MRKLFLASLKFDTGYRVLNVNRLVVLTKKDMEGRFFKEENRDLEELKVVNEKAAAYVEKEFPNSSLIEVNSYHAIE